MQLMPYVLLGERCSGTNIIEKLIETNTCYRPKWSVAGFKHFPKPITSIAAQSLREIPIVVVVRDPFNWVESFYKSPWHAAPHLKALPLSDFIREEWYSVWDDDTNCPSSSPSYMTEILFDRDSNTNQRYESIPCLRAGKLNHMLRLSQLSTRSVVVRLEDYQSDPIATAQVIFDTLGANISGQISIPQGYKGSARRSSLSFFSKAPFTISRDFAKSSLQWLSRPFQSQITSLSQKDKDYLLTRLDIPTERRLKYL